MLAEVHPGALATRPYRKEKERLPSIYPTLLSIKRRLKRGHINTYDFIK
jgi:hypothetical protein